ncbi:MAG: glycosyltransferase [Cyanobacteria bacterium J06626_18]
MKKIMLYCQHLAGMGHLVRSTEIIRSLVKGFKVCFVNGGQPIPEFELPPEVEVVYLPGLWQDGDAIKPVDDAYSPEETQARRQQRLLAAFNWFEPDCLITECFPFSKLRLKSELKPLLQQAKDSTRPVRIVCSLRDLIMTQPMAPDTRIRRAEKICRLVNRYYDAVLFHSDASFQKLEDCFPLVDQLEGDIIYTGYVAQSLPKERSLTAEDVAGLSDKAPTLVASVGGGRHGYIPLNAIIETAPRLSKILPHHIYAFAGPYMPERDFARLQQAAANKPNITLRRFTSRLIEYLEKADLSISLGGYNTTMNLLRTGVPAIVLPSLSKDQNNEQQIRAAKLAKLGVINLIQPEDLTRDRLIQAITTRLAQTPTAHQINLQGADNTAGHLQELLAAPALESR